MGEVLCLHTVSFSLTTSDWVGIERRGAVWTEPYLLGPFEAAGCSSPPNPPTRQFHQLNLISPPYPEYKHKPFAPL